MFGAKAPGISFSVFFLRLGLRDSAGFARSVFQKHRTPLFFIRGPHMRIHPFNREVLILAVFPILLELSGIREAFFFGALVALGWSATFIFFGLTRAWFPEPLLRTAVVLWLAGLAQLAWYQWGCRPLWVFSVAILLFDHWDRLLLATVHWKKGLWDGVGFAGLCLAFGSIQELCRQEQHLKFFQEPAGWLLILTVAVVVWRKMKAKAAYA